MLGAIDRIVAMQDVGGLPERQAEIGPLERNIAESYGRPASGLLSRQPGRVRVNPRKRNPRLNAPLRLDELDLHVDRCGQLGLGETELPQLADFPGLGAWRTNGAFGHAPDCTCGIRRARN